MAHIDGYADFLVEDIRVKLGYDAKDNSHDDEVLAKLTAGEKISKSKHLKVGKKMVKSKDLLEGLQEAVRLEGYLKTLLENKKVIIPEKDNDLLNGMDIHLEKEGYVFSWSQNVAGDILFIIHE